MVCCIGSLWKNWIAWRNLCTNQQINSIIFDPQIVDFKYWYYFCTTLEKIMKRIANQAVVQIINKSQFSEIQIPLPPLATQHAITRLLDDASASIHTTTDALHTQIAQLDELRASTLDEMFGNEEWEKVKLGEIATIWPKKSLLADFSDDTKVSFVPMADLWQEQKNFDPQEERLLGEVKKWYTYFENNDVLLAKVTPCFENGKCGIASNLTNWIGFWSSEFIVFRPLVNTDAWYLYYFLSRKSFREEWAKNMWWAVWLQRIKKDWLENIQIPLPDLATQHAIVSRLDHLSQCISLLRSSYTTQLTHYEELRASILDQAFSWQLIQE